jgi:hypothetical protein
LAKLFFGNFEGEKGRGIHHEGAKGAKEEKRGEPLKTQKA